MAWQNVFAKLLLIGVISEITTGTLFSHTVRNNGVMLKTVQQLSVIKRPKRDIMDEIPSIIQCSANCLVPMIWSIVQDATSSNSRQQPAPNSQFSESELDSYCKVFRNASSCTDACPSTSFRDTVNDVTATSRFICVEKYQEFQRLMPCINKASSETENNCASRCAQYDNMEQFVMTQLNQTQNQYAQSRADGSNPVDDFFGEFLRRTCEYASCYVECERQILISRCGQEAQTLMQELVTVSYRSFDHLTSSIGFSTSLPAECVQLESGGQRPSPQPPNFNMTGNNNPNFPNQNNNNNMNNNNNNNMNNNNNNNNNTFSNFPNQNNNNNNNMNNFGPGVFQPQQPGTSGQQQQNANQGANFQNQGNYNPNLPFSQQQQQQQQQGYQGFQQQRVMVQQPRPRQG